MWYVVSWAGVITPWALSLLALGGRGPDADYLLTYSMVQSPS